MTDKEIEKALKCCSGGTCRKCPYYLIDAANCIVQLEKDVLDYINRLKAEKEQIRKDTAREVFGDLVDMAIKRDLTIDDINSFATVYGVGIDDKGVDE